MTKLFSRYLRNHQKYIFFTDSGPFGFAEFRKHLYHYNHNNTFSRENRLYQTLRVDKIGGKVYVQLNDVHNPIELLQDIPTTNGPMIQVSEPVSSWTDVACRLLIKAQSPSAQSPTVEPGPSHRPQSPPRKL